jgi:hypothetical protein
MAVILLFFLIQTYRFATISSMNMGEAKMTKRGLMIYLPANFFINRGQVIGARQSVRPSDKRFGKGRFTGNN